ncbi:hypothetical protein PLANPX_2688 [Lacipirellula parvula]|uniref:Uncharacterized protein n=1 Tax=Lacipirellula parvula TaxID=2650471 RepID=A0A5K7XFG0_9BACT|nr:hypothetical protein PLANPX_2688 [Lacipirellula parvula]
MIALAQIKLQSITSKRNPRDACATPWLAARRSGIHLSQ